MRNRRSQYRAERSRAQRDGSAGMALFKKEERERAYKERWRPDRAPYTLAKMLTGGPKRGRRRKK
jgi:hypothetical protein